MNWPKKLELEKKKHKPIKVKLHDKDSFSIGREAVDLRYVEQLTDGEQTQSLGRLLLYGLEQLTDGKRTLPQIADQLDELLRQQGMEGFFSGSPVCGFATVRRQEIFACLNRFRR